MKNIKYSLSDINDNESQRVLLYNEDLYVEYCGIIALFSMARPKCGWPVSFTSFKHKIIFDYNTVNLVFGE